jgi:hypothetical protein
MLWCRKLDGNTLTAVTVVAFVNLTRLTELFVAVSHVVIARTI